MTKKQYREPKTMSQLRTAIGNLLWKDFTKKELLSLYSIIKKYTLAKKNKKTLYHYFIKEPRIT